MIQEKQLCYVINIYVHIIFVWNKTLKCEIINQIYSNLSISKLLKCIYLHSGTKNIIHKNFNLLLTVAMMSINKMANLCHKCDVSFVCYVLQWEQWCVIAMCYQHQLFYSLELKI